MASKQFRVLSVIGAVGAVVMLLFAAQAIHLRDVRSHVIFKDRLSPGGRSHTARHIAQHGLYFIPNDHGDSICTWIETQGELARTVSWRKETVELKFECDEIAEGAFVIRQCGRSGICGADTDEVVKFLENTYLRAVQAGVFDIDDEFLRLRAKEYELLLGLMVDDDIAVLSFLTPYKEWISHPDMYGFGVRAAQLPQEEDE